MKNVIVVWIVGFGFPLFEANEPAVPANGYGQAVSANGIVRGAQRVPASGGGALLEGESEGQRVSSGRSSSAR
jgi:hypothetical protein